MCRYLPLMAQTQAATPFICTIQIYKYISISIWTNLIKTCIQEAINQLPTVDWSYFWQYTSTEINTFQTCLTDCSHPAIFTAGVCSLKSYRKLKLHEQSALKRVILAVKVFLRITNCAELQSSSSRGLIIPKVKLHQSFWFIFLRPVKFFHLFFYFFLTILFFSSPHVEQSLRVMVLFKAWWFPSLPRPVSPHTKLGLSEIRGNKRTC